MPPLVGENIGQTIRSLFVKNRLTLGIAESCTGGSLSSRLTLEPGCSDYFLGAVIAYSDLLKINLLGVDPVTIERNGAVSEPVVLQMAEGMIRLTECDYALAVSGIAGPGGGTEEKPVGTVWVAIVGRTKGRVESKKLFLPGSREEIIRAASDYLLSRLQIEIVG